MPIALLLSCLSLAALAGPPESPEVRSAYDFVRRHQLVRFPTGQPLPRPGPRAPDHQVGDARAFWSWDLSQMPPRDVLVPATCRAVGAHVFVFVADDQWGARVTQVDVDAVLEALESSTPAGSVDPQSGIVPNEVAVFGPIPDALDANPHLFVLLMELKSYGGQQFDGFFNAFNQYPDEETVDQYGYHSNEIEMITVNSVIRSVSSEISLSILAHELEHLIHWGSDVDEVAWVDESCAEAAMTINGYYTDQAWLDDYLADPAARLSETEHVHYGACLLFGSYLYERFGAAFLTALVADPNQAQDGFSATLADAQAGLTFDALLLDWATATLGDSLGASDTRFSHPLLEVGAPDLAHDLSVYPTDQPAQGVLPGTGTAYLRLAAPAAGADLELGIEGQPADRLLARALVVAADGSVTTWEPELGALVVPFSTLDAPVAHLVLLATDGGDVEYAVSAEAVEPVLPDGGDDGGEADGGESDGGGDAGDSGTDDAGADETGNGGSGCGCGAPAGHLPWLAFAVMVALAIRRRPGV